MEQDAEFQTPGQLIEKLLAERDWTGQFLAMLLDVSQDIVSRTIVGKRAVDARMALDLGEVFNVDPSRFLKLQQAYEMKLAQLQVKGDPMRATRANLFGNLPVTEMIKRRWLNVESIKDVAGVERELKKFFGVPDLNEIETLPFAAKRTNVVGASTETMTYDAQMTWLYRVKKVAQEMMTRAPYSQVSVRRAIKTLEPLMKSQEGVRKVPRVLDEAGIRFVVMESIGRAKIDGACFWLNEQSPVIGMTLRYDRIDNFWFVLRHELEHVDKMHGREGGQMWLDFELEGSKAGVHDVAEEERIANEAAANFGFTQEYLQKFISRKAPFFRELDVIGFANVTNVHPGIVVGRLQHATDRYDLLRKHLVAVRSHIVPSAMVDGWGDVAPVEYDD